MPQDQTLVSIVLPTHNRADKLSGAIRSILRQTYVNWELIVVDDDCTDNTQEVVQRFQAADQRIRLIQNNEYPHGPGGARNCGVSQASGEYIGFLDDDDEWTDNHIQSLVCHMAANHDIDWVFADFQPVDESGQSIGPTFFSTWEGKNELAVEERGQLKRICFNDPVFDYLKFKLPARLQVSLIRSHVFQNLKFRDNRILEDMLFLLEYLTYGFQIAYLEECHLLYLVHEGNISGARANAQFQELERVNLAAFRFHAESIPSHVPLSRRAATLCRKKAAEIAVWRLGNCVYRDHGMKIQALRWILNGIRRRPFHWRYWKTLIGAVISGWTIVACSIN